MLKSNTILRALFFGLFAVACAWADNTISAPITGTCGFTMHSTVVYSESFSGNGTFCTGFMSGGFVTVNGNLQVGDLGTISALSSADVGGKPPNAFYAVFADISTTFSFTQEFLAKPLLPAGTPTGTLQGFLSASNFNDGTGIGACQERASVSLAGQPGPTYSIPITFGQTIEAVETVSLTCHKSALTANSFGDDGKAQFAPGLLFLFDANGKNVGQLTAVTAPEAAATSTRPWRNWLALSPKALTPAAKEPCYSTSGDPS